MKDIWTIREAKKNDESQVVELLNNLMKQHYIYDSLYEPSNDLTTEFTAEFNRIMNNEDGLVLIAENTQKVIGVLTLEILDKPSFFKKNRYGYVVAGIIKERYRGRGVMYSLYKKGMEWFRSKSVDYVELDIHIANSESRKFSEEQGFKKYKEYFRKSLD